MMRSLVARAWLRRQCTSSAGDLLVDRDPPNRPHQRLDSIALTIPNPAKDLDTGDLRTRRHLRKIAQEGERSCVSAQDVDDHRGVENDH